MRKVDAQNRKTKMKFSNEHKCQMHQKILNATIRFSNRGLASKIDVIFRQQKLQFSSGHGAVRAVTIEASAYLRLRESTDRPGPGPAPTPTTIPAGATADTAAVVGAHTVIVVVIVAVATATTRNNDLVAHHGAANGDVAARSRRR